jgi:hypothetical protein
MEVLCTIVKVRLNLQHTFTIIIFASALSLMVLCDATIIKYISSTAMYDLYIVYGTGHKGNYSKSQFTSDN